MKVKKKFKVSIEFKVDSKKWAFEDLDGKNPSERRLKNITKSFFEDTEVLMNHLQVNDYKVKIK